MGGLLEETSQPAGWDHYQSNEQPPYRFLRNDLVEGVPVASSLFQDRLPTQARLRSFEYQKLEQGSVVMDRHAPFLVVILHIQVCLRPRATANLCSFAALRHRTPRSDEVQVGDRPLVLHVA